MKKYLPLIFILILVIASFGCVDQPEPPGAGIPRLVMDYDQEVNETIIHLRGMEIIRYDNITLFLNDTKISQNHSYSLEHRTEIPEFDLRAEVKREENIYQFNATFTVKPDVEDVEEEEEEPIFRVTYYDGEEEIIYMDDLPLVEVLALMEENI